jgi:uncharacterized protein YdeI (YjbR/CyaY-like superfamily)
MAAVQFQSTVEPDGLAYTHKREHVLAIEGAKKPETRARRIEKALAMLRDGQPPRS